MLTLDFNDGGTVTCSGGKIYTSANLHQGDTLRVGDQLVGFQEIGLNQGTFTSTNSNSLYSDVWFQYDTITIGANGVISYSNPNNDSNNGDYTPNGNAWMVTHYFGGSSFRMSGIQADGNSDDIVVVDDTHVLALPGTTVRITATPDEKYYLQGWGDQAEPVISAEPVVREFVMGDHDTTITATFAPFPTLTLAANDPVKDTVRLVHYYTYGTTEINDIIQSGDLVNFQIINFIQNRYKTNGSICSWGSSEWGSNINVGTNGAINITSGSGRIDTFTPVTENGEDGNAWRVSEIFHDEYNDQLSVVGVLIDDAITPPGIIANSDGTYSIFPGTTVTLRADATGLNHITGWSTGVETDLAKMDVITVTVFSDTTITANFAADPQVTLASNNEQMGTVAFQVKRVLKPGSLHVGTVAVQTVEKHPEVLLSSFTSNDYGTSSFTTNDDIVRVSFNNYFVQKWGNGWTSMSQSTMTISPNHSEDYVFTRVVFSTSSDEGAVTSAPFEAYLYGGNVDSYVDLPTGQNLGESGVIAVKVYGYAVADSMVETLPDGVEEMSIGIYSVFPGTEVTVKATAIPGNHMASWNNNVEVNSLTDATQPLTVTKDSTITANFAQNPTLTLAANGDGTVELEGAAGSYDILVNGTVTYTNVNIPTVFYPIPVGTQIYSIEGANGKIQSDGDFYKITDFFEGTATVQTNGGNFTVSLTPSLPAGIVATETEGHYLVLPGIVVTINATTNQLRHVAGWSDEEQNDLSSLATYSDYFVTEPENLFPAKSSINVTVTGDTTMMASFGINSYTVTAKVNNDNRDMIGSGLPMGSVSATYIAVDGTPDQSVAPAAAITYTAQGASTSTLTAIPDTGYHFVKWNDDVTDNPRSLTLTVDSNLTAIFAPNSYTVTYLRGRGTIVLNVDTFKYREPITDYTPLRDGRSFIEWRPALPTYMPAENLTVVAYWKFLSVEDYDGNVYPTVNISDICWMAANMRAAHFADGRELNNIYECQCDMYPNVQETVSIFGRLYEWYDAVDTSTLESSTSRIQGICPDGWVLPNDEDFEILNNMDVQTLRSTNYWLYNSGNNSTGFDLRPAGMYNSATARYENLLGNTYLWSATTISSTEAHCHMADCNCYMLMDIVNYKSNAFSVRCIKE